MITIEPVILEVLKLMQKHGSTYISGGYLRDKLTGEEPNDVDIITELPIEKVQSLFPNLQYTENGFEFGVGRFVRKGVEFEVTSYTGQDLHTFLSHKDYTMNALIHDGEKLHDSFGGVQDIQHKIIRSLEDPATHFVTSPQAYLRAIRLAAQLNFKLDSTLFAFLKENKTFFYENNDSRIQQEGYKIIRTKYTLIAFELLNQLNFITTPINTTPAKEFPVLKDKPYMKCLLLSEFLELEDIYTYIDLFQLSKQLKEKLHYLYPYVREDTVPHKPYVLNEIILLKRMQYQHEPKKFQDFLSSVKNQKK